MAPRHTTTQTVQYASRALFLAALAACATSESAIGQGAVAFQPTIATFPDGVMLNATPVVSYDRRYVRLGVDPQFTTLEQFNTFVIPAAVSGGGLGVGGGLGGVLGGGNIGGFASMPASGAGLSDPLAAAYARSAISASQAASSRPWVTTPGSRSKVRAKSALSKRRLSARSRR
jgi:hypothetical protein